jgi:hypothetical protein
MLGRDPGLGQPPDHQQLAQMPRVGAVALGALLGPAPRRRLRRLGEMNRGADRPELLDHEPPAGRRLQRHLDLLDAERSREAPDAGAVGRRDPLARDLARAGIQPLGGDLRSVLVESHYDRHSGASSRSMV